MHLVAEMQPGSASSACFFQLSYIHSKCFSAYTQEDTSNAAHTSNSVHKII